MRLNRCKFIWCVLVSALLLVLCSVSVFATVPFERTVQDPYNHLLESLKNDKNQNIKILLMQWEDYIASVSTYSCADYAEAIQILQQDYYSLIAQMGLCLDEEKQTRKNFDPAWVVRLVDHFGVDYLKAKEESVYDNIRMILAGSQENCCGSINERLFFKETALYSAYRDYFHMFLDFYNKQPAEAQEQLKSRKDGVDNFMELIDRISIVKVITAAGMHRRQLSEIKAKNSDKAIYDYFKANPPGCAIDPFKTMEAYRKAMNSR